MGERLVFKFRRTLNLEHFQLKMIRIQEVGRDTIEISVLYVADIDTDEEDPKHLIRFTKKVRVELDRYFPELDYATAGKNIFVIRSLCPQYESIVKICMENVETTKDLALLKLSGKYPSEVLHFYRDVFMNSV